MVNLWHYRIGLTDVYKFWTLLVHLPRSSAKARKLLKRQLHRREREHSQNLDPNSLSISARTVSPFHQLHDVLATGITVASLISLVVALSLSSLTVGDKSCCFIYLFHSLS
ncbi:hypothetical protein ACLOJK_023691 [Asimina triloba]